MVCSLGSGRMTVMARLLEAGNFSQHRADEASNHKLSAQNIYRKLRDADEANFLDEEGKLLGTMQPPNGLPNGSVAVV